MGPALPFMPTGLAVCAHAPTGGRSPGPGWPKNKVAVHRRIKPDLRPPPKWRLSNPAPRWFAWLGRPCLCTRQRALENSFNLLPHPPLCGQHHGLSLLSEIGIPGRAVKGRDLGHEDKSAKRCIS